MKRTIVRYTSPKLRRIVKARVLPPLFRAGRRLFGTHQPQPLLTRYGIPEQEVFAGYYDIMPHSSDGGALLAHASTVGLRSPTATDESGIGFFDRETRRYHELGRTTLWCWQLGARVRWWPGEARGLAYNAMFSGSPAYCLARPGRPMVRLVDRPLFDSSNDGRVGLSLNFGRLAKARPGYGYVAISDPFADQMLPERDGVTIVDLENGTAELIADMSRIAALSDSSPRDFHYLTAASLSPSGKNYSVMHKRLKDPLRMDLWELVAIIGASDGSDLQTVPLPGGPSHYWWLDDQRIAYTSNPRGFGHSSYYLYDLRDHSLAELHSKAPKVDGHPSLHEPSGRWVTDRYPDLFGEQTVYVLEPDGKRRELAVFRYDPSCIGEWRCDLHPRWAPSGEVVVVDSTHEGRRAIYEIPVPARPFTS